MQLPDRMTDLLSMVRSGSVTVKQVQDAQKSKALELNHKQIRLQITRHISQIN
jgi:hypothetical protein